MNVDLDHLSTELKKELSSLIISCPKGITVRQLRFDYQENIGRDVPFHKLGYPNFFQYLLSVPDTCRVVGYGDHASVIPVVTEKNKHINEMILRQKAPKSHSRYRPPRRSAGVYNVKKEPAPPPKPDRQQIKLPIHNPDGHKKVLPPPHDYVLETRRTQQKKTKPQVNQWNSKPQSQPVVKCEVQPDITQEIPKTCDNRLNNGTENKINESNKSKKEMYTSHSTLYEKDKSDELCKLGEPSTSTSQPNMNYRHNNYNSYNDFDSDDDDDESDFDLDLSDGDDFSFKSEDEEDVKISETNLVVGNDQSCLFDDPIVVQEPHVSRVNDRVKEKLKKLIADYPDGIWCSKLLRYYEEKFNQKLDPVNFGFSSVIQMCDDLPDIFYCIRPNRTDWKLYDRSKPVPDIHTMRDFSKYLQSLSYTQGYRENTEPALPQNIMLTSPAFKYPEEVVQPGELINRQWLLKNEKSGEYIELVISEVYDPSKFWIQLKGPETSDALSRLMDDMQLYYMHHAGTLQLNEFSVRIGLMCAALFMNEFHRAIVIKVFDDQTIKVFYVDYGTVAQVQLRRTCFLHRDFSELPMQAMRARLANIIPKEQNTMWSRSASKFMLHLIMEKDLIAYINSIDYEQEILDLIVTDTTQPDVDVHINDALVENGFAILGNEAPLCSASSAIISNVHLYPAFEELENGIYPCVSDVITMVKLGHTYETIFHGYFATPASISHPHDYSDLHNSRCTSLDQSLSQSFNTEQEAVDQEECHEHYTENANEEEFVYQETSEENCPCEDTQVEKEEENTEFEPVISEKPEITQSFSNEEIAISPVESLHSNVDDDSSNFTEDSLKIEETNLKESLRSSKPPPGFENVPPQNYEVNQFLNIYRRLTTPLISEPVFPMNPLSGYPLVQNPLPQNQFSQNPLPQNQFPQNTVPQNQFSQNPLPQNQFSQNPLHQNQFSQNTLSQNQFSQNPLPQNQFSQNPLPQNPLHQNQFSQNPLHQNQFSQNPLPQNTLHQNPLPQNMFPQNPSVAFEGYPLMNPNLNSSYNPLLSNPLLYNQLSQYVVHQQREAFLQTVHQVKFVEEMQKFNAMKQQQQFAQMSQGLKRFPQNLNIPNTPQNENYNQQQYFPQSQYAQQTSRTENFQTNEARVENSTSNNNLPTCSLNREQTYLQDDSDISYDQAANLESPYQDIKESISNISEHICDRFVIKLKINDCSSIHVLKIEEEFYVVSQEIVSNLLKNDLSWKKWIKSANITADSFPNKLVNIMNYENVYNQVKSYSIPGINSSNNLGCIVRLTSLNDVADIIEKFGNRNILPDLKAGINYIAETPDMWKEVLDSSD